MKKNTLHTKITAYSSLAVSLFALQKNSEAQIIYTDVNPDSTITNGFYNLDLNNDGLIDFKIEQKFGTSAYGFNYQAIYIHPEFAPNAIDTATGGNLMVHATDSAFNITASLNWVDSATTTGTFTSVLALDVPALYYDLGNFLGQNGKFLPVKFDVSGLTHFGWVRLNVNSIATAFTVIDYAYESSANTPILTGHFSTVGIIEKPIEELNVYANNKTIIIDFAKASEKETTITILNNLGQIIKKKTIHTSKSSFDLTNQPTGIYIVQIQYGTNVYSKKIILR